MVIVDGTEHVLAVTGSVVSKSLIVDNEGRTAFIVQHKQPKSHNHRFRVVYNGRQSPSFSFIDHSSLRITDDGHVAFVASQNESPQGSKPEDVKLVQFLGGQVADTPAAIACLAGPAESIYVSDGLQQVVGGGSSGVIVVDGRITVVDGWIRRFVRSDDGKHCLCLARRPDGSGGFVNSLYLDGHVVQYPHTVPGHCIAAEFTGPREFCAIHNNANRDFYRVRVKVGPPAEKAPLEVAEAAARPAATDGYKAPSDRYTPQTVRLVPRITRSLCLPAGTQSLAISADGRRVLYGRSVQDPDGRDGERSVLIGVAGDRPVVMRVVPGHGVNDGRLPAQGNRWACVVTTPKDRNSNVAVIDTGHKGPEFKSVHDVTFSADGNTLAYIGTRTSGPRNEPVYHGFLVINGKEYDLGCASAGNLIVSDDGSRVVCTGSKDIRSVVEYVFENGVRRCELGSDTCAWLKPMLAPDGRTIVYSGPMTREEMTRRQAPSAWALFFDHEPVAYFQGSRKPVWSPDAKHWAWVTRTDLSGRTPTSAVVVDGKQQPGLFYEISYRTFEVDDQGRTLFVARLTSRKEPPSYCVVRGLWRSASFPEIDPGSIRLTTDGKVAYVVAKTALDDLDTNTRLVQMVDDREVDRPLDASQLAGHGGYCWMTRLGGVPVDFLSPASRHQLVVDGWWRYTCLRDVPIAYSPDGRHCAAAALVEIEGDTKMRLLIDGEAFDPPTFSAEELIRHGLSSTSELSQRHWISAAETLRFDGRRIVGWFKSNLHDRPVYCFEIDIVPLDGSPVVGHTTEVASNDDHKGAMEAADVDSAYEPPLLSANGRFVKDSIWMASRVVDRIRPPAVPGVVWKLVAVSRDGQRAAFIRDNSPRRSGKTTSPDEPETCVMDKTGGVETYVEAVTNIVFSADGKHWAGLVRHPVDREQAAIISDGKVGPYGSSHRGPFFLGGSVSPTYIVSRNERLFFVSDGIEKPLPEYCRQIDRQGIVSAGMHIYFMTILAKEEPFGVGVFDRDRQLDRADRIEWLRPSPDGSRVAWLRIEETAPNAGPSAPMMQKRTLVVDSRPVGDFGRPGDFIWSNDGKHWACTAWSGNRIVILLDGREVPCEGALRERTLAFDPKNRLWGVKRCKSGNECVWHEGRLGPEYPRIDAESLTLLPNGTLAYSAWKEPMHDGNPLRKALRVQLVDHREVANLWQGPTTDPALRKVWTTYNTVVIDGVPFTPQVDVKTLIESPGKEHFLCVLAKDRSSTGQQPSLACVDGTILGNPGGNHGFFRLAFTGPTTLEAVAGVGQTMTTYRISIVRRPTYRTRTDEDTKLAETSRQTASGEAFKRAEQLRNPHSYTMALRYVDPASPNDKTLSPYGNVVLNARTRIINGGRGDSNDIQISRDEANKLLNYLTVKGFLDSCLSIEHHVPLADLKGVGPSYRLEFTVTHDVCLAEDLGLNPATVERLKVLREGMPEAAHAQMDALLAKLEALVPGWQKEHQARLALLTRGRATLEQLRKRLPDDLPESLWTTTTLMAQSYPVPVLMAKDSGTIIVPWEFDRTQPMRQTIIHGASFMATGTDATVWRMKQPWSGKRDVAGRVAAHLRLQAAPLDLESAAATDRDKLQYEQTDQWQRCFAVLRVSTDPVRSLAWAGPGVSKPSLVNSGIIDATVPVVPIGRDEVLALHRYLNESGAVRRAFKDDCKGFDLTLSEMDEAGQTKTVLSQTVNLEHMLARKEALLNVLAYHPPSKQPLNDLRMAMEGPPDPAVTPGTAPLALPLSKPPVASAAPVEADGHYSPQSLRAVTRVIERLPVPVVLASPDASRAAYVGEDRGTIDVYFSGDRVIPDFAQPQFVAKPDAIPCRPRFSSLFTEYHDLERNRVIPIQAERKLPAPRYRKHDSQLIKFSPGGHRAVYLARKPGAMFPRMVIDGRCGPEISSSGLSTIVFSPNGKRLAWTSNYRTMSASLFVDGKTIVEDRRIIERFRHPAPMLSKLEHWYQSSGTASLTSFLERYESSIVFSPDSKHVAYLFRLPESLDGGSWNTVVNIDDREIATHEDVVGMAWSPDSRRLAYVERRGVRNQKPQEETDRVICGDMVGPWHSRVAEERLVFSPDSRRVAYVAMETRRGPFSVVLDGKPLRPYAFIDPDSLWLGADGSVHFTAATQGDAQTVRLTWDRGSTLDDSLRIGQWVDVVDAVETPLDILPRRHVVSTDLKRRVRVLVDNRQWPVSPRSGLLCTIEDGALRAGPYANVLGPELSPDGRHWAAVIWQPADRQSMALVVDGVELPVPPGYETCHALCFAENNLVRLVLGGQSTAIVETWLVGK